MTKTLTNCGSWPSPYTAPSISERKSKFLEIYADNNHLFFTQVDPAISKNPLLFKYLENHATPIIDPAYTPHTAVHEFGGGSFAAENSLIVFSNKEDGAVYICKNTPSPTLIFQDSNMRFANFCIDPKQQWIFCICENHIGNGQPTNTLVLFDLTKPNIKPQTVHSGYDFYSSPSISPCGGKLAFIAWNHPYMPWDQTELLIAALNSSGSFVSTTRVMDGKNCSLAEPRFARDSTLFFTSNISGFSQIYTYNETVGCERITHLTGDISTPAWVFNLSRFAFLSPTKIAFIITENAIDALMLVDINEKTTSLLNLPFNDYNQIECVDGFIYTVGASAEAEKSLLCISPGTGSFTYVDKHFQPPKNKDMISKPVSIKLNRDQGPLFAFFYPPKSPLFAPLKHEKIPLIVKAHSGPTLHSKPSFQSSIQFWTSRGFAFMEVNYRGSSGYGKDYQNALYGHWGDFDSTDCIEATEFVIKHHNIDPNRIIIKGSSAGGLTVLKSLIASNLFKAGISYYGISDLLAMYYHTDHKFESHYTRRLIGKMSDSSLKKASPLAVANSLKTPLLFFQGGKDKVVPESQSRSMHQALVKNHVPTGFGYFKDEGHGFRARSTLITCLNAEEFFIAKVLNLNLAVSEKSDLIDWDV
ncbi:hypothetical protein COB21_03625 [Candidatus Aerophobetes bacterium]|uniref:Peptidase S9 prolyl oligopeptidase catalytic domain-containing protein n=1 Tax=Aerophobetes bacterium TaxID=2030807 RepID=A0A2A4X2X1_UNCAE|nr:MAG: hypothetical protein COB21_03625 [Candidatus Aerophobetes bacterium]